MSPSTYCPSWAAALASLDLLQAQPERFQQFEARHQSRLESVAELPGVRRPRCLGTMAAFGTYTVGFVARPVGGIVIGQEVGRALGVRALFAERQDGVLTEIARPPVMLAGRIAARLKVMARLDIAERRIPQDGRIKMKLSKNRAIDFRVNTCPTLFGEKVVCRLLDPSSAQLGIWFAHRLNPDSAAYNIGEYLEIEGALDIDGGTDRGGGMVVAGQRQVEGGEEAVAGEAVDHAAVPSDRLEHGLEVLVERGHQLLRRQRLEDPRGVHGVEPGEQLAEFDQVLPLHHVLDQAVVGRLLPVHQALDEAMARQQALHLGEVLAQRVESGVGQLGHGGRVIFRRRGAASRAQA